MSGNVVNSIVGWYAGIVRALEHVVPYGRLSYYRELFLDYGKYKGTSIGQTAKDFVVAIVLSFISTILPYGLLFLTAPGSVGLSLLAGPVMLVVSFILMAILVLLIHGAARLFGGKGSLSATVSGLIQPYIAYTWMFVPIMFVRSLIGVISAMLVPLVCISAPFSILLYLLMLVAIIYTFYMQLTLLSREHGFSKLRSLGAIVVGGVVGALIAMLVLAALALALGAVLGPTVSALLKSGALKLPLKLPVR